MSYQTVIHIHMGFAILFLLTYVPKSIMMLIGKDYLPFKKKTFVIETIFSVLFLLSGFYLLYSRISFGYPPEFHKWLDPKITLAIVAIPIGIIGFKKSNKIMVALSLLCFIAALIIGLSHFKI